MTHSVDITLHRPDGPNDLFPGGPREWEDRLHVNICALVTTTVQGERLPGLPAEKIGLALLMPPDEYDALVAALQRSRTGFSLATDGASAIIGTPIGPLMAMPRADQPPGVCTFFWDAATFTPPTVHA